MSAMKRYYFHGDLKEGAADLYFCRCCDVFADSNHFHQDCATEDHLKQQVRSKKALRGLQRNGYPYSRPTHALNYF